MQARMIGKIPLKNETKFVQEKRATNVKTGANNSDTVDQYHGVFTDQFIFRPILKHYFLEK